MSIQKLISEYFGFVVLCVLIFIGMGVLTNRKNHYGKIHLPAGCVATKIDQDIKANFTVLTIGCRSVIGAGDIVNDK